VPLVPVELSLVIVLFPEFVSNAFRGIDSDSRRDINAAVGESTVPESGAPVLSILVSLELPLFVIHTEPVASAIEFGVFRPPST
jgi:hypothetical protein